MVAESTLLHQQAGSKLPDDPSLDAAAFPGFILFPQNLNGWNQDEAQHVIRIIRLLSKKYNIDPDRIYIHGLSNGGKGVYEVIKRAPWMFASAITMSAIDDAFITRQNVESRIAAIPLWIFQGALDENPWPAKTEAYMREFRDAGATIRYTFYPDVGHSTWNRAYREPDFFSWMLGKRKSDLQTANGSTTICSDTGSVMLLMSRGFFAYQWERDGQIISGANEPQLKATQAGRYRVRFSRVANPTESQWNEWSAPVTITKQSSDTRAVLRQEGTTLLRDLNGGNTLVLEAEGNYAKYLWFRNGTRIDIPGTDQDDTVKRLSIGAGSCAGGCANNGAYTLVTSTYEACPSAPSAPVTVFFSDQAPVNLTAPSGFAGQVNGPAQATLTWNDVANETGYEIWRRRKEGTTFEPWYMAVLTGADARSFVDSTLVPSSEYEYKIRAVSNTGRSNYSPDGADALKLTTTADSEAPEAPEGLTFLQVDLRSFQASWKPASDNAGIRRYVLYVNDDSIATETADTTFLISNLPLNQYFTVRVRAEDLGGNLSEESLPATITTYIFGLYYEHTTGTWPDLDSINWDRPEFTGHVNSFTLTPRTQDDYFNFRFTGYIYINEPGTYQFRTVSDDGSRLVLDGRTIVENDGIHLERVVTSANQNMTAGAHSIRVDYFDYAAADTLAVAYRGPDTNNQWQAIGEDALKSAPVTAVNSTPEPVIADVFPNPVTGDSFFFVFDSSSDAEVAVVLIDATGRYLFREEFEAEALRYGVTISPEVKPRGGLYFLVARQQGKTTTLRVMVR